MFIGSVKFVLPYDCLMQKLTRYHFLFCSILFLPISSVVIGQVKGKILDASGKPLPFCQVGLVNAKDTSLIKVGSTDDAGKFAIEIKDNGGFRVMASYVGCKTFYSSIFTITSENRNYDVGIITMEPDSKTLKNVEVVAQKPFMEYKSDRTVYNIENSIVAAGNNALEVLKKLPGITVDNNDNITANGQSGVIITIDGRTLYMSAEDAGNYLRSLDASQIEKIEIITNPSAKYDASGSTIINIVRKKNKNSGLNTELTSGYSQGIYGRWNEGVNLNYGAKKWSLFANYGYSYGESYSNYGGTTRFGTNNEVQSIFVDSNQRRQISQVNNGRFEADFMPDKKQTIGFVFEGMQNTGTVDKNFPSKMYGGNSILDSSLTMQAHRTYTKVNLSYGLTYDFKIDSTGKDLSATFDYVTYTSHFSELDVTSYYDSLGEVSRPATLLQYALPANINIWAAKIDYEQPVGKNGTFEGGLKGSYVSTNNNAQYWNVVNGTDIVDTTFTNDFTYTEYIYAGYMSYAQKLGRRFYFKFGLRGEETQDKGVQLIHDTTFTHNYFSLFPNGLITYKLDTSNTLKLSYRRRIWRPDYQDLNPFVFFNNPYSYYKGNPNLQPQISNAFYVAEQFKQLFTVSIGDEYWTNIINEDVVQNNVTDVSYTIPTNFKTYNNAYGMIESTIPVKKWFTSMNTLLFMQQEYQGAIQNVEFTTTGFSWNFNSVNMLTLSKNWSGEVDFNYESKSIAGEEVNSAVYTFDAGLKWRFAKDRGTITLNCSDIFFSDRSFTTENFQSENFQNYWYWDSRRLRLTLNWKLGKSEHDRIQKDKAADEEMNRVKNN